MTIFYQLCHFSLVIPILSLALSLAISGLSLLVPSQFQDFPNSSRLTFYQQYINSCLAQIKIRDNEFCDVTQASVDGQKFKAHKVVLSALSIFLKKL